MTTEEMLDLLTELHERATRPFYTPTNTYSRHEETRPRTVVWRKDEAGTDFATFTAADGDGANDAAFFIEVHQHFADLMRLARAGFVYKQALESIAEPESTSCSRCEGGGRLSADGQSHSQDEWIMGKVRTRECDLCEGVGRIPDDDPKEVAEKALKEGAAIP